MANAKHEEVRNSLNARDLFKILRGILCDFLHKIHIFF